MKIINPIQIKKHNYKIFISCRHIYIIAFFTVSLFLCAGSLWANDKNKPTDKVSSYMSFEKSTNCFTLSEKGKSAEIYISPSEYEGVKRAAVDLKNDLQNVTGSDIIINITDNVTTHDEIIIAGTLGKSVLIDRLVSEKKIDTTSLTNKWDAYTIQILEKPFPGVQKALVIAGSNKRGTIYGIYNVSEKAGVSPWYWWADVPVKKHKALFVNAGTKLYDEPAVKYRGIFLNDEAPALAGWVYEKYGGFNHKFYEKVFELILRLKGNFLWPAMWNNNFNDEDSLNEKLADEYGVVMGTSHHEPMTRAWKEWPKYGHGAWNYQTNDSVLRGYWKNGIKRMKDYETVVTLGMRGDGDEVMSDTANIGLLERIIADQRKILADVTGRQVESIPQVWALYKEVQDYYDRGMQVPDDITLLLCDDNWGNIRRLPLLDSKPRRGGYGIYYHFDYVGGPRNYKWLNTTQIERTWEQMHLAYEYNTKQIWIVNVGDLKPMEFPISFFLDYAWNPNEWNADNLQGYYKKWSAQQFGNEYADDVADIIKKYTKYNSRKKPELLEPGTYSLVNYREAERVSEEYNKLNQSALKIYNSLSGEYKDTFFQLVLHPVSACANLNNLYITADRNHLYAKQGRALTNDLADSVRRLFKKDADISLFYNKTMANGKWNHMMDQTHIGYTYWQQPDSNNMPAVKSITLPKQAELGVEPEGSEKWFPQNKDSLVLPIFDSFNKQTYYIDVFNRGTEPLNYKVVADKKWIVISDTKGTVEKEKRIYVNIDWEKAPKGETNQKIEIIADNAKTEIGVYLNNAAIDANGFIESNGYVSIEAEHYSREISSPLIRWQNIENLGRSCSAVSAFPVTVPEKNPGGNSPHLEYDVYLFNTGVIEVNGYFSPTLKFQNKDLFYAISIDDEMPQIIKMTTNGKYADLNRDPVWNKWVADNINTSTCKIELKKPGAHILKYWYMDPGVVLQKIVLNTGGVKKCYLGPPESYYKKPESK